MSADQTFRERRIAELERHAGVLRNRIQELAKPVGNSKLQSRGFQPPRTFQKVTTP